MKNGISNEQCNNENEMTINDSNEESVIILILIILIVIVN